MEIFVKFIILFVITIMILIKSSESRVLSSKNIEIDADQDTERCRNKCIYKLLKQKPNIADCPNDPNCFMCWDYCRVIAYSTTDLANSMCGDELFCSDGCKVACIYHKIKSVKRLPNKMENSV